MVLHFEQSPPKPPLPHPYHKKVFRSLLIKDHQHGTTKATGCLKYGLGHDSKSGQMVWS